MTSLFLLLFAIMMQGCPDNAPEYATPACDDGETIDGYWWQGESWVPGLIRNVSQFVDLPPVMRGRAVWYAPGLMEATAKARGLTLEGYVDGVASMSCADIGQPYWIGQFETSPENPIWEGPFLVVDCPQLDDVYGIIVGREEVVEVGWKTAERWGDGDPPPGGWQVFASRIDPSGPLPVPIVLSSWFPERAKFYFRAMEVDLDPRPLYRNTDGVVSWRIDGVNWVYFSPPAPFQVPVPSPTAILTSTPVAPIFEEREDTGIPAPIIQQESSMFEFPIEVAAFLVVFLTGGVKSILSLLGIALGGWVDVLVGAVVAAVLAFLTAIMGGFPEVTQQLIVGFLTLVAGLGIFRFGKTIVGRASTYAISEKRPDVL